MKIPWHPLAPPVAVGIVLRGFHLRDQVLVGDEVHAIRAALHHDLATVLTTYREADPCLPLAGLFRMFIDLGLPLSEMLLRLPVLVTGVAALVALPLILGTLAPRARWVFAWLLALSPTLILYSRIVRPYAPIVLWTGLAAGCFWIAWNGWRAERGGATRRAKAAVLGFLASSALALWFHLGAAPLIIAFFAWAVLDLSVTRPPGWPSLLLDLVIAALALATLVALLLLPAAASLGVLIRSKRVPVDVPAATYLAMLKLGAGSASTTVALVFALLAVVGLVRLFRRHPRAALFTVVLVAGQVIGIRLLSPIAVNVPIAFHRYALPVLPFVLMWVAVALSPPAPRRWRLSTPRLALALQAGLLAGLVLCGPFTDRETWRTSFLHDVPYVDFSGGPPRPDATIAAQNAFVARPGGRPVIAATWPPNRYGPRQFALGQQIHGRRVIVVAPGLAGHPTVAFRNFVAPDPRVMQATGAQFFLLHGAASPDTDAAARGEWPQRLRREWGAPAWRARGIEVWDLDAVRRGERAL